MVLKFMLCFALYGSVLFLNTMHETQTMWKERSIQPIRSNSIQVHCVCVCAVWNSNGNYRFGCFGSCAFNWKLLFWCEFAFTILFIGFSLAFIERMACLKCKLLFVVIRARTITNWFPIFYLSITEKHCDKVSFSIFIVCHREPFLGLEKKSSILCNFVW